MREAGLDKADEIGRRLLRIADGCGCYVEHRRLRTASGAERRGSDRGGERRGAQRLSHVQAARPGPYGLRGRTARTDSRLRQERARTSSVFAESGKKTFDVGE